MESLDWAEVNPAVATTEKPIDPSSILFRTSDQDEGFELDAIQAAKKHNDALIAGTEGSL
jgi:hypothetical protein